jgi:phage tail sheath protein FI
MKSCCLSGNRTTMTKDDINNGSVNLMVGFALIKPAEFVVIKIGQITAGAHA